MTTTEAELWARARTHDGRAFAELFDLHRDRVFRHSLRLCDGAHDAEEVTAAAFFELWRRRSRVALVNDSVLPWLLVTASKLARNSSRGIRRYRALFDSLPRGERMPDAEEQAMTSLRDSEVTELLDTLPPVDAALITLVVLEGYPTTEAAALLKISDGAARTRLHRAKHKLRGTLMTKEAQ